MRTTTLLEEPCNGSLKIGDLIRMVKPIGDFDMVGKIFEIEDISGDVYKIVNKCIGFGYMNTAEYKEYFEKVEPELTKSWTEWTETKSGFEFRTDNKKYVEVKKDGIIVRSSCHPIDKFSVAKGVSVCLQKLKEKEKAKIENNKECVKIISDSENDMLYISIDNDTRFGYVDRIASGVYIRRDSITNEIRSVIIDNFHDKVIEGTGSGPWLLNRGLY